MVIRNCHRRVICTSFSAGLLFDTGEKLPRQPIKRPFSLPDKRAINTVAMLGT